MSKIDKNNTRIGEEREKLYPPVPVLSFKTHWTKELYRGSEQIDSPRPFTIQCNSEVRNSQCEGETNTVCDDNTGFKLRNLEKGMCLLGQDR